MSPAEPPPYNVTATIGTPDAPSVDLATSMLLTLVTATSDGERLSMIAADLQSAVDGLTRDEAIVKLSGTLIGALHLAELMARLAADALDPECRLTPAAVVHGARERLH